MPNVGMRMPPHNVGIYRPSVYSSLADNYCRNPGGSGETRLVRRCQVRWQWRARERETHIRSVKIDLRKS